MTSGGDLTGGGDLAEDSKVKVYVEKCRDEAIIPVYAKEGDAGMDVCAAIGADIYPGQTIIIPTGLKLAIPTGYEIQVRPRSGLSYKTFLRIANSPGTIDSGYRDELGIIISNTGFGIGTGNGSGAFCAGNGGGTSYAGNNRESSHTEPASAYEPSEQPVLRTY